MLTAVITVLLQVLYLAGFDQGGGKAADVGLDLRGDGVRSSRSARWDGLDGDEMARRRARFYASRPGTSPRTRHHPDEPGGTGTVTGGVQPMLPAVGLPLRL